MSKIMSRLEKLEYFTSKHANFQKRATELQAEMTAADGEWATWLEVMKIVLETSVEPSRIIT